MIFVLALFLFRFCSFFSSCFLFGRFFVVVFVVLFLLFLFRSCFNLFFFVLFFLFLFVRCPLTTQ